MCTKMGNTSSQAKWTHTFLQIKSKHDLAFIAIEEAITLEERERPLEALEKYKNGIQLIDEALNIQVTCPEEPDDSWEQACTMIQKIKRTRAEVLIRINSIQGNLANLMSDESPPSYEEAMSSTSSSTELPRTYTELAAALNQLKIEPPNDQELIYTHDNVRLYFISPNGEVTSTKQPQTLCIYTTNSSTDEPKSVLQIGDWVYPLVAGVSPCYRTNYGAFILPDVHSNVPGCSVGIILPSDADEEVFDLLESILHGIIRQKRHISEEDEDVSKRISSKIVDGAWIISQGLIKGAEKAGGFVNNSTPKVIERLTPADRPKHIPRGLSKSMQVAETTTKQAVRVTGFLADKVGAATLRLGNFLAPHIQKQGTRLLATSFNMPEDEASNRVRGILTVAAGAVEGFSTIYRGLETSASILGDNLKNNTVKIVQHKYGAPAGEFTGDTLTTVGNVYNISKNAKVFTPKGVAKKTAGGAGRALVEYNRTTDGASTSYGTNKEFVPTNNGVNDENNLKSDIIDVKKD